MVSKYDYIDCECPDCGEILSDDLEDGDECPNCGHIFTDTGEE